MLTTGTSGSPFGSEPLVPQPPRGPTPWKWILLVGVIVVGLVLAIGVPALAHSTGMAGGCGGG